MARKNVSGNASRAKVGDYSVLVEDFEKVALPSIQTKEEVFLVDEIGKMELFSRAFENQIEIMLRQQGLMIATVPLRSQSLRLVERLKQIAAVTFTVTNRNRDVIFKEILETTINKVPKS